MGVPLLMEPNFGDYSCQVILSNLYWKPTLYLSLLSRLLKLQFKFGVLPPQDDTILKEPCLEACPSASRRRMVANNVDVTMCPKTWIHFSEAWGFHLYVHCPKPLLHSWRRKYRAITPLWPMKLVIQLILFQLDYTECWYFVLEYIDI